jgi:GTP cyclohydrolase I
MEYLCHLSGDSSEDEYTLSVSVPVLSLCPCSKEISDYGAHNQRSKITISIKAKDIVWIEDIIEIAEASASSEIYSILKREDEKYVTEKSYENPMFVEDMVRAAAEQLMEFGSISWFSVASENLESIHNHSAYACIEKDLR